MKTITIDFLTEQRESLKKEIESLSRQINQAYGAIRLVDFLIGKEKSEDKKDVPSVITNRQAGIDSSVVG